MQSPSRLGIYALLFAMPLFFVSNLIIGRAVTHAVEPGTLALALAAREPDAPALRGARLRCAVPAF